MHFNFKRFTSVFLALFISVFSILSCTVTVRADNLFTYGIDAVKFIRELFGAVGDVATGSYDFGTKVANDVADLMSKSQDTATDYGVIYNDEDKNFYFKQDSDNNVYINQSFYDAVYNIAEKQVTALDGYYLFNSSGALNMANLAQYLLEYCNVNIYNYSVSQRKYMQDYISQLPFVMFSKDKSFLGSYHTFFFSIGGSLNTYDLEKCYMYCTGSSSSGYVGLYYSDEKGNNVFSDSDYIYTASDNIIGMSQSTYKHYPVSMFLNNNFAILGQSVKIFYSLQDVQNYLNSGRHYIPKIKVDNTIKLPREMFDNATLSNKINEIYNNLDVSGKAEADIQADLDLALKNYLDSLFGDINPSQPTSPTPTPSHGGSGGDFGDGVTPTPTPVIGDGGDDSGNGKVDLTETNSILKDILKQLTEFKENVIKNLSELFKSQKEFFDSVSDWLTSFSDSHTKFEKTITDYIEANDGKLDQIIDAIDKLSQGKEDGEDYKCKYDYTELSDYLKKLWNDSDKKFDTMIDLLEENNEYQQKLVDTLDSIKSILIKESIMDSFKDRSKETANKAKEKFPTSVPWDIAIVINAMSATPEEPKFNLPIKIASMNIDENIEVDLSSGEWAKLAKTCRYMLSLLFILFMVQLSRRLFFNKGDDD